MSGVEDPPAPPPREPLGGPLAPARLVERPNRFLVRARREGELVEAHLPNPGRLEELLVDGRRLRLRPAPEGADRKTDWTAVLVETPQGDGWVSLDTTLPNRLVGRALRRGWIEELAGWTLEGTEVALGDSRLDFVLSDGERRLALEVKSVTLVRERVGRFPDAVTARGTRHVRELAGLAGREGWSAAVLFVAQRPDVDRVVADEAIDPAFAAALRSARAEGVRALARRCRVDPAAVELGGGVPVGRSDGARPAGG